MFAQGATGRKDLRTHRCGLWQGRGHDIPIDVAASGERIEQARVDAEREARMRVEAAEAAERMRLQAAIEQQRMQEENELRRAEIAKKRPTWMLAVTGFALVATLGFGYFAYERNEARQEAERARIAADNDKRQAQDDAAQSRAELDMRRNFTGSRMGSGTLGSPARSSRSS